MRVISIDPGYERLGIAILEKNTGKESLIHSECFRTSSDQEFTKRLHLLGDHIEKVIREYSPTALCVENLFISNNQKTAMRVAEVRGVILYLAEKFNLKITELTPLQIKSAVAGNGKSSKTEIAKMVSMILKINKKLIDDEFDAIAIGIAFFAYNRS